MTVYASGWRRGLPENLNRWIRQGRNRLVGIESAVLAEIRSLRRDLPEVAGVLVASVDGLVIAHDGAGLEPDTVAAMCAAQLGLGQQMVATLQSGAYRETVTRGTSGYIATFAAGPSALLSVIAGPDLNVGRLHHQARPVAARIGEIVSP